MRRLGRAEYRSRIETESGNNGDAGLVAGDEEVIAPVQVTRRWTWPWKQRAAVTQLVEERWYWKKRALDAEREVAWKNRALDAEKQVKRERREREAIERVKVKEVLREKTDLYERIEALEAELEEHRRNPE